MEVTTVSPRPASPTEGDDVRETDVTSVAIHNVTLLICLCGLAGNGAVIGLLNQKSRNYGIFNMAFADFLFLLLTALSDLIFLVEDVICSPILPLLYLSFLLQLSVVSYCWALFWLIFGSPVVYMDNLCKLCCRCNLPECLVWVANSVQYWAIFAVFTVIPMVTFVCPSQEQEYCRAALISMYTIILLLFAAPVLISSTILFIKAKWSSKRQQPKRHDIVILLIVPFTLIISLWNFLQEIRYIVVSSQVFFPLICIIDAASNPSSTSWQGIAGDAASWDFSSSPSRRSLRSQEKQQPAEMMCPETQWSQPVFHFP